jgi:hypothetical protein
VIQIFTESEDTYRQLVTSNFDPTPYTIEYEFVKLDGTAKTGWTAGTWDGAAQHTDTFVWQRWSLTPKVGPDGGGDIALSVGDWGLYARINERLFYVDLVVVKAAGTT